MHEAGFTLIELVVVVVIVGVITAAAVPKFTGLGDRANEAVTEQTAGSLAAASAINLAARQINPTLGSAVSNCTDVAGLLEAPLAATLTVVAQAVPAGESRSCTLNGPSASSATFTAHGVD